MKQTSSYFSAYITAHDPSSLQERAFISTSNYTVLKEWLSKKWTETSHFFEGFIQTSKEMIRINRENEEEELKRLEV